MTKQTDDAISAEQADTKRLPGAWRDEHGWWHYPCPQCKGPHVVGACPKTWEGVPEDDFYYQMYGPHTY